jgi:hypothetical protein
VEKMLIDSKVSEHVDTKPTTESVPSSSITMILVKWRPFGRLSNRRAKGGSLRTYSGQGIR